MNITINNYNMSNNVNYRGFMKRTPDLNVAIEKAGNYDLHKFSNVLKRMSKSNDNIAFEVKSSVDYDGRTEYFTKNVNLIAHSRYDIIHNVGTEKRSNAKDIVGTCYDKALKNINHVLEEFYPESEKVNVPREQSLKEIDSLLS